MSFPATTGGGQHVAWIWPVALKSTKRSGLAD